MTTEKQTVITKDRKNKKMIVTREFDAPVDQVWKAWTESSLLDQWWAPKPWQAKTKQMDFREGGSWLYVMQGPEGEQAWSRADFKTIEENKSYTGVDSFCDENGNPSPEMPSMLWKVSFSPSGERTMVTVEITFDSEADMEKIIELGFEEGFTSAHTNLDGLLKRK